MTTRKERKQRRTLTVLFAFVVFIALFLTTVIVGIIAWIMLRQGMLSVTEYSAQGIRLFLLILMAASLVVGSLFSLLALRMPLTPINRLIHGLNLLAEGEYSTRFYPKTRVEKAMNEYKVVQDLTASFNTLAAELENTEMLRSDFINNFSHEFKTPIVSIAGFAKLLKRGNLTEEQKTEYLDIIEEESLRLSAMATNVLNLTKVENQTILSDTSEYNLSEQLRTCVLLLEAKWTRKRLEPELDFDEIQVKGSEELLKEVWINLLDNAVKFAPEGSSILLKAEETPEAVTVTVKNEGPDIPPEAMNKVFNKFYQADESHATEGNGVGLAIVKRVVDLHGGTVGVKSQNGITAFTVRLPRQI